MDKSKDIAKKLYDICANTSLTYDDVLTNMTTIIENFAISSINQYNIQQQALKRSKEQVLEPIEPSKIQKVKVWPRRF
jgi:hypothetical protein